MQQQNRTTVRSLDPLTDPRWVEFVEQHPQASIFHTREWLATIHRTYGYEPVALTTSSSEELTSAIVFCRISSWLTGRRLVSLPFSDHCQPLAEGGDLQAILDHLSGSRKRDGLRYVEIRPAAGGRLAEAGGAFGESGRFSFQKIDLRAELKTIYGKLHDSCIRRKIKRAEKESLTYEAGRSEELLRKFRHLLLITRRRHKLPPQPAAWFDNIAQTLGDKATIHLVSKDGAPAASILTLAHKKTLTYKYGCSDGRFNNMGGTPLLFWKAIQQAKEDSMEEFDLGRSDYEDPGLIAFKEHLGAISAELAYYRNPAPRATDKSTKHKQATTVSAWAREALVRLPDPLLAGVGQLVYRHIG